MLLKCWSEPGGLCCCKSQTLVHLHRIILVQIDAHRVLRGLILQFSEGWHCWLLLCLWWAQWCNINHGMSSFYILCRKKQNVWGCVAGAMCVNVSVGVGPPCLKLTSCQGCWASWQRVLGSTPWSPTKEPAAPPAPNSEIIRLSATLRMQAALNMPLVFSSPKNE